MAPRPSPLIGREAAPPFPPTHLEIPMDITSFRKTHQINPECRVLQARLQPAISHGCPLSLPHFLPTPLRIQEDGSLEAFAEDRLGIEYQAELLPEGPLGAENELDRDGLRSCLLSLELPSGLPFQCERALVLREVASILAALELEGSPCVVVGLCQDVEEYGQRFVRCQPMAVFAEDLVPLWIHPAAPRFGLIQGGWPVRQSHRALGERKDWTGWTPVIPAHYADPATGLPGWYARGLDELPIADAPFLERHRALIHHYGEVLRTQGEVEALPAGFQRAQQEFEEAMGRFFGPRPGLRPTLAA